MNTNPSLKKLDIRLSEFERKIEEDGYDSSYVDFAERFSELEEKFEEISEYNRDKEGIIILKAFQKRLDLIRQEQDLYD